MNTKGYGGRRLSKTIHVITDDPVKADTSLTVAGKVSLFATITPRVVRFNGKVGDVLKQTITVTPEGKYAFVIKGIHAKKGEFIKYAFEEVASTKDVKSYAVTVENLKKDAGSYYDVIILETDSKIQPEIKLNIMARILDPNAPAPKGGFDPSALMRPSATGNKTAPAPNKNANSFLDVIQKMQKQQKTDGGAVAGTPVQDPERAAELKKKFEELIKKAQEQQTKDPKTKDLTLDPETKDPTIKSAE